MTGAELRAIRLALGLTQEDMGEALGVDGTPASCRRIVSAYELGERAIPKSRAMLAEALRGVARQL